MSTNNERKELAARLTRLADRLTKTGPPPNTNDTAFERTGLLMVRVGLSMIDDGDRAYQLARDASARGYPAGTNSEPGRSTSGPDADVTLTSVEAGGLSSDHWERELAMLDHERRILDSNSYAIDHRIFNIVKVEPNQGRKSTLIDCANPHCDATITGLGTDRPRRGRCWRCYEYLRRTGRDWTSRQDITA